MLVRDERRAGSDEEAALRVITRIQVQDNRSIGTGGPIQMVETAYGRMLLTETDPFQGSYLRMAGISPEDESIEDVRSLLRERPRGAFIDIGASFGCWSLALARDCTEVMAIEPQLPIYNMLCGSIVLNGLSRHVRAVHGAAGAKYEVERILATDPEILNNFGAVSLAGQVKPDLDRGYTELVEVWAVDELVDTYLPDQPVSLIKIDVEGFEEAGLVGASDTIARWKPILHVEWALSDEQKLAGMIHDFGYEMEYRGGDWLCLPI